MFISNSCKDLIRYCVAGFVFVVLKRFEEKRSNYLLLLCDDQHEALAWLSKIANLFMVADDFLYLKCIAGCIAVLLRIMH